MKLKKRTKVKRMRGHGMGSHGWGARKKHISSGNRGGFGMAGTGKMAGHKHSYITKLYGTGYLGKRGITSKPSAKKINEVINVSEIEAMFDSLKKRFGEKNGTLNMKNYKILGDGEIKIKASIKAKSASQSAKEKIEKAGGKLILPEVAEQKNKNSEEKE